MDAAARRMDETARRLRNRDYRDQQIARAAARGERVTHEDLLRAADRLCEGADRIREGARSMRIGAERMQNSSRDATRLRVSVHVPLNGPSPQAVSAEPAVAVG